MKYVGIVGHAAEKFTPESEETARAIIRELLIDPETVCVSGACHLGGVDQWAAEESRKLGKEPVEFPPKIRAWEGGYKQRNLQIAEKSDVVHVIVVDTPPEGYTGMRFEICYHCGKKDHTKSGGCWTAKKALAIGKEAVWHVIRNPNGERQGQ